ncbi:LVIVD repeat-containing protein [Nocardioides dilutus]
MVITGTAALRRLLVVLVALAVGVVGLTLTGVTPADGEAFPAATPPATCGPGARPETGIQGRVPLSDYTSGRVAQGYRCNTRPLARQGKTGGFKVLRYQDAAGHTCAFYDSTLLFPKDVLYNAAEGLGVVVLDMDDPKQPRKVATLSSPAMLSPHESLVLNERRGLLAAVLGNPFTNVGVLDIYDVRTNCRKPKLLSSTNTAVLGHESGFAPDGRTFYASSTGGQTLAAVDVSDPRKPKRVFFQSGVNYHGLRLSPDGRTMYVANIGNPSGVRLSSGGLRILDVSQIQDRKPDPKVKVVADLDWPEGSLPQVAEPFTKKGRDYLLEVDEFVDFGLDGGPTQASAPVGAARIIDVEDPAHPKVVSHLRLAVHQPGARAGDQQLDPGALIPVQGYAGHYCSLPRTRNPRIVGCSMILSGLRLFDIRDPQNPREVAYFNDPTMPGADSQNPTALGAFAMSAPAWDPARGAVWFTDANKGFFVVALTNGVERLLRKK